MFTSCELLSFIVSLLFENSIGKIGTCTISVVNCFHLSYLCSLKTAFFTIWKVLVFVVNCFHLSYLCSLKTAFRRRGTWLRELWIAFIYRIFALWKQRVSLSEAAGHGCELLSFIVSLLFENSRWQFGTMSQRVVNCFHLSYLCSLKTAWTTRWPPPWPLWIAFIYRIFALWKQLQPSATETHVVVNCFHLSYLCSLKTAGLRGRPPAHRCELLSFIVSLLFENSKRERNKERQWVVNCFHLSYLCSLKTADIAGWNTVDRCELLSFIVSLLFENSCRLGATSRDWVVNCFHLSYLCSLKTAQDAR